MKRLLVALMILGLLATPCFAGSKTLKFQWNQADADMPTLKEWVLYKSISPTGPWEVQERIPAVPLQLNYTAQSTIIVPDNAVTTLHFSMTAIKTNGFESGRSNVVNYIFDFKAPDAPINFSVTVVTP